MVRPGSYEEVYRRSIADSEAFWLEAANDVSWTTRPEAALDESRAPLYSWFPGGELNTSYNALDRHVDSGNGESIALIYHSAMLETHERFSYRDLRDRVARFAGALRDLGVERGDRVLLFMPMIPEAVIGMLACARLGAIHSVVFGGFAANELAKRIDDAGAVVILTATGGLEPGRHVPYLPIVEEALAISAGTVRSVVVKHRPTIESVPTQQTGAAFYDWDELSAAASPAAPIPVSSTDPLYILYTSGTTGMPKGVVRDNGGHAVALTWSLPNVYGIKQGDVIFAASDVGWAVGHTYIVYAPLFVGATAVLYEGKPVGTPDASVFWRIVEQHRVNVLLAAPTAIRAIRKVDPEGEGLLGRDLSSLRALFLAGERLDPDTWEWASKLLQLPVIDHWWQTETGWPICANPLGIEALPMKAGSPTVAMPGYEVTAVDAEGRPVAPGVEGNIVIKLPLPPGTVQTLWGADERMVTSYLDTFPGHYLTGDSGHIDHEGYVYVMGRTDDIINVAGHRLSTGSIEQVVAQHPDVAECAVIGLHDELKGEVPFGLVVLKAAAAGDPEHLEQEVISMIRQQVGAIAAPKGVVIVPGLPKTRSGKVLRKTIRSILNGAEHTVPPTIEDAAVLLPIEALAASRGSGPK